MEVNIQKILIVVFRIFHGQHFENVDHGGHIFPYFIDNIIICHKNIYQMLKHVCVVPQHAFRSEYYKLS